MEKYKIYLGVKYVKLVVRPYKTRDVFTNLSGSPPTIYLNEYLIDDEEVVEYLIIREMMHIKLHNVPSDEVHRRLVLRGEVRQHPQLLHTKGEGRGG